MRKLYAFLSLPCFCLVPLLLVADTKLAYLAAGLNLAAGLWNLALFLEASK